MNRLAFRTWLMAAFGIASLLFVSTALTQTGGSFNLTWLTTDNERLVSSGGSYNASSALNGPISGDQAEASFRLTGAIPVFGDIPTPLPSPSPTESPTPTPLPINAGTNGGSTLPHTVPPGVAFGIGITLNNTGTTTWSAGADYALAILDDSCGLFGGNSVIYMSPHDVVPPGEFYQFVARVTIPGSIGPCTAHLQLVHNGTEYFGDIIALYVIVAEPPNQVTKWAEYE